MKVLLLLPLLFCLVVAIPDREERHSKGRKGGFRGRVKLGGFGANVHFARPGIKFGAQPALPAHPVVDVARPGVWPGFGGIVAQIPIAKPYRPRPIKISPNRNRTHSIPHMGCDYVAFSDRAFTMTDVVISGSFPTPASCIAYLKLNQHLYRAVDYNYQTSTCRAVMNPNYNQTAKSLVSTIYMMKVDMSANAQSLGWFLTFVKQYRIRGRKYFGKSYGKGYGHVKGHGYGYGHWYGYGKGHRYGYGKGHRYGFGNWYGFRKGHRYGKGHGYGNWHVYGKGIKTAVGHAKVQQIPGFVKQVKYNHGSKSNAFVKHVKVAHSKAKGAVRKVKKVLKNLG